MEKQERFGGLAKVGKKSSRGDQKRRGTPIPVAPPRVPTPMPQPGEVEKRLAQQKWRSSQRCQSRLSPNRFHGEQSAQWTGSSVLVKELDATGSYPDDDSNRSRHQTDNNKSRLEKSDKNQHSFQRRMKMRWFQAESKRDRARTKSDAPSYGNTNNNNNINNNNYNHNNSGNNNNNNNCTATGLVGMYVDECLGKRGPASNVAGSLTCAAIEDGCVTSGTRSGSRFATKVNNNYNLKYYGFVDSREEDGSDIFQTEGGSAVAGGGSGSGDAPATRDAVSVRGERREVVYENLRMDAAESVTAANGKRFAVRSGAEASDRVRSARNRCDPRTHTFDNLSRRLAECNFRLGKYDRKLSDFSVTESSFRDIYNAGVINGSAYDEYTGLQDGLSYLESKYAYTVAGMPGSLAQASAAAAFFARASQKLNLSSPHRRKRHPTADDDPENSNGFSGAIHRSPPPMPPALLRRIGVKEVTGVGKVKVMLRVTGNRPSSDSTAQSFFNIDGRKKQVTLYDPAVCGAPTAPEDRRVGIAAPKMFAFDAIFSEDDSQAEICATALTEVIHAVINGTDGCLFCFGHAKLGKTATMLGSPESSSTLGIIPCAISWLFRGIHEQKQKTGARFSVRVSAVEVCQPTQQLKDLLAGHANDCEQSPGVYLRDDPLFGTQLQNQSELRVPNAEKAAFYLDAAVNSRSSKEEGRDSHFLYTLHVYQYSVAGKGGVAGGRSRLHLIDLGSCDRSKANGGIPLSGLGNVLLSIFNGQKHLPYREHKITQLLKECLSSLTCHAAMIAHVSQSSQHYTDTLATVQLASRIHRMRRRKIKFGGPSAPTMVSAGSSSDEITRQNTSTGSSDFDPSSSEQSADTVIYVGPTDDTATDGEHPPVYIPSLNSGDNRCAMGKALRGSIAENHPSTSRVKHSSPAKSLGSHKISDDKSIGSPLHKCNKSGISSSKSSPVRTATNRGNPKANGDTHGKPASPSTAQTPRHEEQWIDGPRISKQKVAEARNILLKEHMKKETWIDGPMQKTAKPTGNCQSNGGYGFMDSHKKTMIRKWVENQTVQLRQTLGNSGVHRTSEPAREAYKEMTTFKTCNDYEEVSERHVEGSSESAKQEKIINEEHRPNVTVGTAVIKQTDSCVKELNREVQGLEESACGESSESSEEEKLPPPPLPLMLRYGKDMNLVQNEPVKRINIHGGIMDEYDDDEEEIELEIVEVADLEEPVPMQDSCLQVTEEDIALCMGEGENPLPEVDQESHEEHPLRILSEENLTVVSTFTDSMSVTTDLERCLPRPRYEPPSLFDQPFQPNGSFYHDEYIELLNQVKNPVGDTLEQLTRLHHMYKSKLAIGSENVGKTGVRCQSLSLSDFFENNVTDCNEFIAGNCSIYSEPAYRPPKDSESMCNSCKKDINQAENAERILRMQKFCDKLSIGTKRNISSLRHPDGASNPSLDEEEKKERLPGNGASKSDFEDDSKDKSTPKKKVTKEENHRKGSASNSPIRKANYHNGKSNHDTGKQIDNSKSNESYKNGDIVKINESNLIISNSPTRNSNSPSRGELRRTNSSSTNKSRRVEDSEDVTKCSTPPPASSSSPLTQKHLYFNKTCPSNEGSDSGHESNVSPKIAKISMRSRPQVQCESSGYESVVSFTSSLDSEVGVKLVRDDPEEVHDPGGQSTWWCWCVSGRPTAVQGNRRQPQRRSTGRSPLTIPPTASHPKD